MYHIAHVVLTNNLLTLKKKTLKPKAVKGLDQLETQHPFYMHIGMASINQSLEL